MLAIRAMTAWRPMRTLPTSTMGFTNEEEIIVGVTNLDHHSKVIRISNLISIQITILINLL
jgi:hypothetical protein